MDAGPGHLLLLCHSGGWDRLHQAASCAASAAGAGWSVDLVFYHGALAKLLEGRLDEVTLEPRDPEREAELRERVEEREVHGPWALLQSAREMGAVRLLACSASCALLGRDAHEVGEPIDAVVGWPTVTSLLEKSRHTLYL